MFDGQNIGLNAGILSELVFTMFVVMALVTTFATTPLVTFLYPPQYQMDQKRRRGEIGLDGNNFSSEDGSSLSNTSHKEKSQATSISKITVLLRLENLPGIFAFVDLLGGKPALKPKVHKSKMAQHEAILEEQSSSTHPRRTLEVHGERVLELTQRTSAVMQVSEVNELQDQDPVVNVFRAFGSFHNFAVSASVSIAPVDSFAEVITSKAAMKSSELLLVPWTETGAVTESPDNNTSTFENRFTSHQHNQFIANVLSTSTCSTAIMVNRGFGSNMEQQLTRSASHHSIHSHKNLGAACTVFSPISDPSHHIFFPFFGGVDDRVALRFVLQMVNNTNVTATIVHIEYSAEAAADPSFQLPPAAAATGRRDLPRSLSLSHVPTLHSQTEETQSSSDFEDNDRIFFQCVQESLLATRYSDRVVFESVKTPQPLQYAVVKAKSEVGLSLKNAGDLIVLGRNIRSRSNRSYIRSELVNVLSFLEAPSGAGTETRKCLGDVAEAIIVANVRASILVFQAGGSILKKELNGDSKIPSKLDTSQV
jgi:hypothetical protein